MSLAGMLQYTICYKLIVKFVISYHTLSATYHKVYLSILHFITPNSSFVAIKMTTFSNLNSSSVLCSAFLHCIHIRSIFRIWKYLHSPTNNTTHPQKHFRKFYFISLPNCFKYILHIGIIWWINYAIYYLFSLNLFTRLKFKQLPLLLRLRCPVLYLLHTVRLLRLWTILR